MPGCMHTKLARDDVPGCLKPAIAPERASLVCIMQSLLELLSLPYRGKEAR